MDQYILVLWTAGNLDEARNIIRVLLEKKLIACASIFPLVESWYVWDGTLVNAQELKVFTKTTLANYLAVESVIQSLHSYEVPEIVSLRIEDGNESYLKWVSASLGEV